MTNTTKHGGPAFPVFPETSTGHSAAFRGMSLRDYFAGQALAGCLAATAHPSHCGIMADDYGDFADEAYVLADAMLKARGET